MDLNSLLQYGLTIAVGAIGYFLKENKKANDDNFKAVKVRIENLSMEMGEFKREVIQDFVYKDEYKLDLNKIDSKLDKIIDDINKMYREGI